MTLNDSNAPLYAIWLAVYITRT